MVTRMEYGSINDENYPETWLLSPAAFHQRALKEKLKQPGRAAKRIDNLFEEAQATGICLLYTSPSPRDRTRARMPSSA